MSRFKKYWIFVLAGTVAVSFYPLYMGFKVIFDMLTAGTVTEENFPKYIIPYTPIAIAVIVAAVIMPLLLKHVKKHSTLVAGGVSVAVFFAAEFLFEKQVIVTTTVSTSLESWQMFMCYIPPDGTVTRTWTAIDILIGEYSPTFKLHFYLISVVLVVAIVNVLYGFAKIIQSGQRTRQKALIVQSICTALFLGLCILACFTAFFRDGEITVSGLSAFLMSLFFILLGITVGTYISSFLIGKRGSFSVLLPSVAACVVTLAMYIGEMFLLSGNLYRFGTGFLFDGIPGIVLAPIDLVVIVLSGAFNAAICGCLNKGVLTGKTGENGDA